MAHAALVQDNHPPLPDIDSLLRPTADEYARTRAIAAMHTHAMLNLRFDACEVFDSVVTPQFEAEHGRKPEDSMEILRALGETPYFKFYSAIRYNAQEMGPLAKQPVVERALPELIAVAKQAAADNPAGGSLTLDPGLKKPVYTQAVDTHLAPGSFHSEYVADDVAQGVLLGESLSPTSGKSRVVKTRNFAGIGESIAYWAKQVHPDLKVRRVLDMATQGGANLVAFPKAFPGSEAYGIDVAAPSLRYGHAKAEAAGVPVHFSQQNAEHTNFPDGHFDLITSSFFLHEIPVKATKAVIAEVYRLLAPGGLMAFMELPPHKACDPFMNSAFDWDTRNNNEPFYAAFRSQDPTQLCVEAGFAPEACFEITLPDVTSFDMARYPAFLRGEVQAPPHGRGGWFIFGGRKPL